MALNIDRRQGLWASAVALLAALLGLLAGLNPGLSIIAASGWGSSWSRSPTSRQGWCFSRSSPSSASFPPGGFHQARRTSIGPRLARQAEHDHGHEGRFPESAPGHPRRPPCVPGVVHTELLLVPGTVRGLHGRQPNCPQRGALPDRLHGNTHPKRCELGALGVRDRVGGGDCLRAHVRCPNESPSEIRPAFPVRSRTRTSRPPPWLRRSSSFSRWASYSCPSARLC